jgi:hypothetical protein
MNDRSMGNASARRLTDSVAEPLPHPSQEGLPESVVRFLRVVCAQDADRRSYPDAQRSDTAALVVVPMRPADAKPPGARP